MNKKYKLLKDDYIKYIGRTLYRIKALKDFGDVKAGEIGGYIESENNLSHNGECWVYDDAKVFENAEVYGNAIINKGYVTGNISMPYKDIFQHECEYRMLTAILTEDNEILYTIGCQHNITEKEFLNRIYNKDGGLEENHHREEYLKLIPAINLYLKGE